MDTTWLKIFRAVAELGSFTAAGQRLGFTQSAVSRQISALEDNFGTQLFDRHPRGARLTEQGRHVLGHADVALSRLDAARRDIAALRELATGRLRLGSFATAGVRLVPQAIADFRDTHPGVLLSHREGYSRELAGEVRAGDLDLAVVNSYADRLPELGPLNLTHLLDETVLVALPQHHELAGQGMLRLEQLADESWVAGRPSPAETLISACLRKGFEPRVEFVAREWTAKFGFVAAGLGLTLVPALAAKAVREDIVLTALHPDDAPVRAVYAASAEGTARSAAATAFLPFLTRAISSAVPAGLTRGETDHD